MKPYLKILLATLLILPMLQSCQKEEACENSKIGTITISNNSSNPYDVYVDGSFETRLSGNTISQEISIKEGNNRMLYAIQVSGFLIYPTERNKELNIVRCSNYSWQIP